MGNLVSDIKNLGKKEVENLEEEIDTSVAQEEDLEEDVNLEETSDDNTDEAESLEEKKKMKEEDDEEDEMDDDEDDDEEEMDEEVEEFKLNFENISSKDIDISEDLDTLFDGEELSEDFKKKAKTIFESSVVAIANKAISEAYGDMQKDYNERIEKLSEKFETAKDSVYEDISVHLDKYLAKVVNEWTEEHEPILENNVQVELSESFLTGIRTLFAEHYVEIPEDKVDVVNSLNDEITSLEEKLDKELDTNISLSEEITSLKKDIALKELSEGLSDAQKEKLVSLTENISYDENSFSTKVEEIKEYYFKEKVEKSSIEEDDTPLVIEEDSLAGLNENQIKGKSYATALGKYLGKK